MNGRLARGRARRQLYRQLLENLDAYLVADATWIQPTTSTSFS